MMMDIPDISGVLCLPRGGWTRSIIVESAILIAIDFEWDFFKLLLLWL